MITHMRTILIVGLGLFVGVVGCNKGADAAGDGGGGVAASGGRGGTTSLTQAQLDDAYKLTDPDKVDKSLTDVKAKLGAPQKTEGDTSIWYGVGKDGKSCSQLKIGKTKGIESGTTDKANCGLK
jgi:hypothetical protein